MSGDWTVNNFKRNESEGKNNNDADDYLDVRSDCHCPDTPKIKFMEV
jgi:hypothetical protein